MRGGAIHHLHTRKRTYQKLQEYPHPSKWVRALDFTVLFAGMVGPLFSLPQVLTVWRDHAISGLSLTTWSSYLVISIISITYATVHKEKYLLVGDGLFLIVNFLVVLGILLYS
ncbi:hypothetical protein A2755_02595 [Candidatus Wolfebacteria bacterium RIFCSPHIGHO2_01_FULL_48_22]|uniref:Uncharacterized protein n=2 Tax=Candidatus Wolfeibacteriota TaxID=1752735 RepID=A0A1F8DRK4_9BACT|nr:MAG: hypothetical protein A2755_02595 [Candidatus Wolfebacteria bacterium RIFCSPHIGHO2_01_FULL_48_22]OGM92237.1 MAG: hypothetical protein A2935_00470 [Candidatus Wolfebacteria bacterium RIFCSPLOWO2_01_FULL_47_17b]